MGTHLNNPKKICIPFYLFFKIKIKHPIKNENIDNYGYINISILRIYRRYIDEYFDIKYR